MWRVSFPCGSVDWSLFKAANWSLFFPGLLGQSMLPPGCSVWASSKQLSLPGSPVCLSKSLWSLACPRVTVRRPTVYVLLEREHLTEYGQFQGLPQAILTCLFPVVMSFWAGLSISPLPRSFSIFHLPVNILWVKELLSKVKNSLCPKRNCYITASITDHITNNWWLNSISGPSVLSRSL